MPFPRIIIKIIDQKKKKKAIKYDSNVVFHKILPAKSPHIWSSWSLQCNPLYDVECFSSIYPLLTFFLYQMHHLRCKWATADLVLCCSINTKKSQRMKDSLSWLYNPFLLNGGKWAHCCCNSGDCEVVRALVRLWFFAAWVTEHMMATF